MLKCIYFDRRQNKETNVGAAGKQRGMMTMAQMAERGKYDKQIITCMTNKNESWKKGIHD